MLRLAPTKVKHGARSCLGIGDVFLIKKESDSDVVAKYKAMATSEKSRADENAEEILVLRDMLAGFQGSGAELDQVKQNLDDRTGKLREAEETQSASQAAAQAAIEEALKDAASLREKLAKAEEELEAERKSAELAAAQLAEERASKAAVASGSEAAGAMVTKLQAELSKVQAELNEERLRNAKVSNELDQVQTKLLVEASALAALQTLAEQEQKKQAELASALAAQIAPMEAEIAHLKAEQQKKQAEQASTSAAHVSKLKAEVAHLKAELADEAASHGAITADGMAAAAALAMLQTDMEGAQAAANALEAVLAVEKAAHLASEEARKVAMADLSNLRAAASEDPRKKLLEAKKRMEDLMKGKRIQFDGAGSKTTQQSAQGVSQAWSVASLDASKGKENASILDQLAAILKDYPELYCECQGKTDADPTKKPEPGLVAYFQLNSTQAIQDELARKRAVACKEGLVARGVPDEQLVVTWKGCGQESKVDFIPILSGDALQKIRAEATLLREMLANAASQDLGERAAAALKRVQDLLKGNAIQFDGAGAKTTQQSTHGVPQAWNLDSLDAGKKEKNSATLDQLAAILKDYPELYCNLHGSTDADPSKRPDEVLAAHFQLNSTQAIQDELAHNRAVACKDGLEARGVPANQLVVTWKGCGQQSKVDFVPMLPGDALAAAALQAQAAASAAQLAADELVALRGHVATLTEQLAALQAQTAARAESGEADQAEMSRVRAALADSQVWSQLGSRRVGVRGKPAGKETHPTLT